MVAECGRELGAGTREALADRVGFLTENAGDLGRSEAFDTHQECDLAIRRRERSERALECELRLRVGESFERRSIRGRWLAPR